MPAGLIRAAILGFGLALSGFALAVEGVDETALRYYAAQRQTARVEAEAKRLALLHPGWTMPEDIWTARPGQADEKPLWALFAAGEIEALKRAIAARQKAEPGWQPSDDLARKLKLKLARDGIVRQAGAGRWLGVTELAADLGKLAGSDDVELAWIVAEAYARTDRLADAFALYRAILERRSDPRERIATIHKAIALMPIADVEGLLALGRTGEGGAPEFAAIAIDITRARIAAILHDQRRRPVEPAEMLAFEAYAKEATDAGQPGLVAWLALKQDRPAEALAWFKLAIARGGDAMIAHGLAHTLLRLGMKREAEEVAFAWREPLANNAILFIDVLETELTRPVPPTIEPERLARYARVTLDTRSGEGAQALGWYAYNSCQFQTALEWFQRAGAWLPKEATIYGQALALQRLKRQRDFIELVNRYDGLFPKVVGLIFRDGDDELPGPCDGPRPRAAGPARSAGAPVQVPHPVFQGAVEPVQAVRRSDFPLAVSPENPLRFPPVAAREAGSREAGPREAWRPAGAETRPLVARRVPGVTAMPYERFGYALLPGWTGVTTSSAQRAADVPAPRDTLWSRQATQGSYEPVHAGSTSAALAVADPSSGRFRR